MRLIIFPSGLKNCFSLFSSQEAIWNSSQSKRQTHLKLWVSSLMCSLSSARWRTGRKMLRYTLWFILWLIFFVNCQYPFLGVDRHIMIFATVVVQGRPAHTGTTALPVPIQLVVQRQHWWRVGRIQWHPQTKGWLNPDPGCKLANEDRFRRQGCWEQDIGSFGRMGEREAHRGGYFKFLFLSNVKKVKMNICTFDCIWHVYTIGPCL